MSFHDLLHRLVVLLRERVSSGQMTERGLARVTGISQPHIHNVLNGKRLLSIETADHICRQLKLDLLDLLEGRELLDRMRRR
jgi:transcriptional regulator with XRE-family HTH domain